MLLLIVTINSLPARADDAIDSIEHFFGATNINAITGHGRLTEGVSIDGDVTVLSWLSPSYSDQLGYLSSNDFHARSLPRFGAPDGAMALEDPEAFDRHDTVLPPSRVPPMGATCPTVAPCAGDCDGDGTVTVDELTRGVNIALGSAPLPDCPSFDVAEDEAITIDELLTAVNRALSGCGA